MTRDMFHDRRDPTGEEPLGHRPPEQRHDLGIARECPVADDVMGAGKAQVQHRCANRVDADRGQLAGHEPGIEACRSGRFGPVPGGEFPEARRRWRCPPVRRSQTLDPAAFLVHQDRGIRPADAIPELGREGAELRRRFDIAGEDDKPKRIDTGKEALLRRRQPQPRAAENNSLTFHEKSGLNKAWLTMRLKFGAGRGSRGLVLEGAGLKTIVSP